MVREAGMDVLFAAVALALLGGTALLIRLCAALAPARGQRS
jgi:hypothetical protein